MKIRVTKEERLSKAVNRANLVLVEVPVNTKYGQHRSHRWKKAGEALNQLMKDLGRKGNSADIEFVDKKTKKKIGKKELLENYNKVGKVKGQTIQAYVAENYKVGRKKKADGKTNGYKGIDEKKDVLPIKDKMVTMYAKNKYKRQTYTGIGKCGHEVTVEVGGYSEEYRQDRANDEISERMCPECYKKMIEEKRKAAEKEAGNMGLPELEGSPKQINWALSIRADAIKELTPVMDYAQELLEENPKNEVAKKFFYAAQDLIQMTSASDWIDSRNNSFIRMVRNQIEPDLMDDMPPLDDAAANDARNRVIGIYNIDVNAYANLIDNKFRDIEDYRQRKDNGRFNRITEEDFQDIVNKRLKDLNERGEGRYIPEIQGVHEILTNKTNPYMWNATRKYRYAYQMIAIFKYDSELTMPKIGSEEDKEGLQAAYDVRADIASELSIEKERVGLGPGKFTEEDLKRVEQVLELQNDGRFYKELAGIDIVYKHKACIELSKQWESQAEAIIESAKKKGFNYNLIKRFGTKKIEGKGEFKQAKDFTSLKKSLAELKGQHTDVVARACMDMAGIDSPVYVKRNGNSIKLGRTSARGYCQYNMDGDIKEIAVVDHPWNRMQSYKTTVHEVMHGLLAQTKKDGQSLGVGLPKRFNEGIVELVGYTSCKEAYGKDYNKRNVRSYEAFTMDTFLRLRQLPEFKGKTLSQVGSQIGAMAFNRDYDGLDRVRNHLTSSLKDKKRLSDISNDVNKIIEAGEKRTGGIEGVAKRRYANLYDGSTAEYEKTEVAQLVELLKNGGMTMQQALASGRFMDAALVLIYNILDEEDDEELGLF